MLGWQPATETLTVHRLFIHRAEEAIDVREQGQNFTILRREGGLESGVLDGRLSAALQIAALRVGDSVELAFTLSRRNPVLAGHSENFQLLLGEATADRLYLRQTWPSDRALRWQVGDGLPEAEVSERQGETVVLLDQIGFTAPVIPAGAPGRFFELGAMQTSDFRDWSDIAALFAPLYSEAATLSDNSPVRAEIARIAASSSDPKRRAELALQLVQTQVRYLANFSGLSGYVPESADDVWEKHFGDCKGKVVLLMALLDGLGIEATPAVVSATRGDGLDQSLPMPGRFDHVIVKTSIAGRTYWLDATRLEDRDFDQMGRPNFEWALPLETGALEPVPMAEPVLPFGEWRLDLDARQGVALPAPATGEYVSRGDSAFALATSLGFMSEADRNQWVNGFWTGRYDWIEFEETRFAFDEATGETRLSTGTADLDWTPWGAEADRRYEANDSRLGRDLAPERPPGRYADLPVEVGSDFFLSRQTILLPHGGEGFFIEGEPIDETIAGIHYRRTAAISGERFEMEAVTRSASSEISIDAAEAADQRSDALFDNRLFVRIPYAYVPTTAEQAAALANQPDEETADRAQLQAAVALIEGRSEEALVMLDAAIARFGQSALLLASRARIHLAMGNRRKAEADIDAALAREPNEPTALSLRAWMLIEENRNEEALLVLDRLVVVQPGSADTHMLRGEAREALGNFDGALADFDLAIELRPDDIRSRIGRVRIFTSRDLPQEALGEADAIVAMLPENATGHALRGNVLAVLDRDEEARAALERSIALEPTADAYITRLVYQLSDGAEARLADMLASIRLDPTRAFDEALIKPVLALPVAYERLSAAYDDALEERPNVRSAIMRARISLDGAAGEHDRVLAAHEALIAADTGDWSLYNERCWYRAVHTIDLDSALADCDRAVALERNAAALDSRGLTHLRRDDYARAIADYDAALALFPDQAHSLFGRGIAKLRSGDEEGGRADIEAVRTGIPEIEEWFAEHGIEP